MSLAYSEDNAARDPFSGFDISALTRDMARARPQRLGMTDSTGDSADCAALDARASAMAARLAGLGLAPGDTLMIAGAARVTTYIAFLAALRAGLDVALAPLHAPMPHLAAFAARVGANAIASQTVLDEDYSPMEDMFEVAARAPDVRCLCGLGPAPFDGAVDLCDGAQTQPWLGGSRRGRIASFAAGGAVIYHGQRALALAAVDLIKQARVGLGQTILTTLAPVSFAGLVAGPFLSRLADAPLHFHGPFEARAFVDALETLAPAHVITPGALAGPLAEAGLLRPDLMASLMLVDRTGEARGALAPLGDTGGFAIVDLHAFGEQALIAEPRPRDGSPTPPAREPHVILIDKLEILAVKRREGAGPLAFEGEAISAA